MKTKDLSYERLHELLSYDPESGIFIWVKNAGRHGRIKAGSVAGNISKGHGYEQINMFGVLFKSHRLAWLYMTGEWPNHEIDHINRKRADNRWVNLREATRQENLKNKEQYTNNTSGFAGVSWRNDCKKWWARIGIGGKRISLGCFEQKEDAVVARLDAEAVFYPLKS